MARSSQRAAWAKFIERGGAAAKPDPVLLTAGKPFLGRILGIDPSLRGTGLAVVDVLADGRRLLVASKTVELPTRIPFADCLGRIHSEVRAIIEANRPAHVAVEETIYVQNFRTAQILGAARGAAISAPASMGYPIFEYAPRRVKQAVVGTGSASKEQVIRTMRSLLAMSGLLAEDEADAAAVALCHAFTHREP
jgi:crossover junction endodeoxyribonuclease RuvC